MKNRYYVLIFIILLLGGGALMAGLHKKNHPDDGAKEIGLNFAIGAGIVFLGFSIAALIVAIIYWVKHRRS